MKIRTYFKEISRLNPATPSGSKPLVPLAVSAASAIIVMLLIGFGAQNPDTPLLTAAQSDDAERTKFKGTWRQTNGPYGGKILTLYETIDGVLLAGTERAGIFRSTDNGNNWTFVNTGLSNPPGRSWGVTAIAEKGNKIYVGTENSLYFSTDIGNTWQRVPAIRTHDEISDIVILDDYIYVSTLHGTGVLQSKDGKSWTQINDGIKQGEVSTVLPINDNTVFMGTLGNGVFRTTDAGDSWVECNTGIINTSVSKLEVIGDKLYTFVGKNIVCSADGGDTWLPINDPSKQSNFAYFSPTFCVSDGELYIGASFGDDKFLPPHSHLDDEGWGVYRLNRENNTLVKLFTDMDLPSIESMDVVGNTFYMGTWESGVFQWDQEMGLTKLGLEHHYIAMLSANSEYVIAVTGDSEIYRFKENRWEPIHTAEMIDGGLSDLKWIGSTLYATFWNKGVFRSMDGGDTWTSINDGLDDTSATSIGTDGTEVYVSTLPNGTSVFQWIEEKQHWKSMGSLSQQVSSLAVVDGFLYAGTYGSGVYKIRIEQ